MVLQRPDDGNPAVSFPSLDIELAVRGKVDSHLVLARNST